MVALIILLVCFIIWLVCFLVAAIAEGLAFIGVFGDIIIAALIIYFIVKLFKKK